ncbi:MAG: cyclic nucleotide-binding domain-containing protein [Clostridia bacterium]
MKKDDVIFHVGDKVSKICIIDRGSVRGEKAYPNGELHIIQVYDEGNIFAIETAVSKKKTAPIDYICNEDCTVVFISLTNIDNSKFSRQIYDVLMQHMASDNIRKGAASSEILAERGLRNRILMYLDTSQEIRKRHCQRQDEPRTAGSVSVRQQGAPCRTS